MVCERWPCVISQGGLHNRFRGDIVESYEYKIDVFGQIDEELMSHAGGWSIDQVCTPCVREPEYMQLTSVSLWNLLVLRVPKRWLPSIAKTSILVFLSVVGLAIKEATVSSLLHISVCDCGHYFPLYHRI